MRSQAFRLIARNFYKVQKCRNYKLSDWLLQHVTYQHNKTLDNSVLIIPSLYFIDGNDQIRYNGQ